MTNKAMGFFVSKTNETCINTAYQKKALRTHNLKAVNRKLLFRGEKTPEGLLDYSNTL